jgi:hypothetical protein
MYHSCVISAPCIIARFWASQQQDWSSKDWVLKTNYEHPTVETLRVIHNSSVVMFQKPQTQFLSGPPEDPTSNHKFRLSSGWVEGLSMYLSCNRMCICFLKNKSQLVKKKKLKKRNDWNPIYHELLSSAIHELLHPFLTIIILHEFQQKVLSILVRV